jgi:hypothetical protein
MAQISPWDSEVDAEDEKGLLVVVNT